MKTYKCPICGFTYDEAAGLPEQGIAPGTKWEDIPEGFTCPWCGAPKSVFEKWSEDASGEKEVSQASEIKDSEHSADLKELSVSELGVLCANLAKGCEKQYLPDEAKLFYQLAEYYQSRTPSPKANDLDSVAKLLDVDLSEGFAQANAQAKEQADRGALRALVWSEKVSRMVQSLLNRFAKEGEAMLENNKIYVCEICGFVYLGNNLPEICPVCKVPNFKITQVGRR